jgi:hypothetical protein
VRIAACTTKKRVLFGPATPADSLLGKEVFTFKKILSGRRGKIQCDKGIEDRVSWKI